METQKQMLDVLQAMGIQELSAEEGIAELDKIETDL